MFNQRLKVLATQTILDPNRMVIVLAHRSTFLAGVIPMAIATKPRAMLPGR